jgi:hypothetical protein
MATTIQKRVFAVSGVWRWARRAAARAKGSAKTVWLNLMSRP